MQRVWYFRGDSISLKGVVGLFRLYTCSAALTLARVPVPVTCLHLGWTAAGLFSYVGHYRKHAGLHAGSWTA